MASSPIYCSMVFAWSFTEVVRYSHYAAGLVNLKIHILEWLRRVAYSSLNASSPQLIGLRCFY